MAICLVNQKGANDDDRKDIVGIDVCGHDGRYWLCYNRGSKSKEGERRNTKEISNCLDVAIDSYYTLNTLYPGVIMMKQSKIFTTTELKGLNDRLKGSKKDHTGIFGGRIKPKIIELLDVWFPKKKELKKVIEGRK